jgi:hypothetical protein
MKNQIEILEEIDRVMLITAGYQKMFPDDPCLAWVIEELGRTRDMAIDNWPLTQAQKETIYIGVYGARNLDELDNSRLAIELSHLDADLKS